MESNVEITKPKSSKAFRWVVLALMSFVCFTQYYIYDSITPLGTLIKEQLNFSGADYGLLFSAYSAANVFLFMLIIAGILVDKLGTKISGILYTFLCVLGAAITAFGAMDTLPELLGPLYGWLHESFLPTWSTELKIMLLGRVIYGVGAESILVVNNKVLAKWFLGKELAFAYGINLTIMRLGTFLALNLQAPAAEAWGLIPALWLASGVMATGFGAFFLYIWSEKIAVKKLGTRDEQPEKINPEEIFKFKEAFSFDSSFWLISLLCVTFYSAVFPFQAYAPDMLVKKFGYTIIKAGMFTSALIVGTMIFTPILGWFIDKYGKRATLMIYGSLLLIPCHLLLGLTYFPPIVPIFVVGIALSLVPAALWAAIPMMVHESRLGTAFGVIGYIQNVGLMLFPFIAGKIADAYTTVELVNGSEVTQIDYTYTMVMFAGLGIVGFLFSLALKRADKNKKSGVSIEEVMID